MPNPPKEKPRRARGAKKEDVNAWKEAESAKFPFPLPSARKPILLQTGCDQEVGHYCHPKGRE